MTLGQLRISRAPLVAGFILILSMVLAVGWVVEGQIGTQGWVRHTLDVERHIQAVWIDILDLEASQRGYLLIRRPGFLQRFEAARGRLDGDTRAVADLTRDNPRQQRAIRLLRAVVFERASAAVAVVRLYDSGASRAAEVSALLDRGAVLTDQIWRISAEMTAQEERLLEMRDADARREARILEVAMILLAFGLVGLAFFVLRELNHQVLALSVSQARLTDANERLLAEAASRDRAEAQVRQMQKMESLGQLTGGIAHDFNNMLAVVIGSLELAKRRLGMDVDRAVSCIDTALEGAARAAQLTARLLAFSRQQPLEPHVLDVNKFVGGVSELIHRTLGEQVRVETILAAGLWRVFADPGQLENAILNLAINARDAMPEGGRLTVETSNAYLDEAYAAEHAEVTSGQYVLISVSDTGVGMPSDIIDKVFEPFFTTKGAGKGTGLGLSQVYGFIKQSGGHAKIYSEPGHGTTMKIYLPRRFDIAGESITPTSKTEGLPRARDNEIILVVEDDERVRHVSVDSLRELGYTVVQAADASQALAVLALQSKVDLLFTDVVMPDVNGRQLAELVAQRWPGVKTLFTTGYTRNAIVHNGVLDPSVALLAKPFTLDQLARKVRQVLDSVSAG